MSKPLTIRFSRFSVLEFAFALLEGTRPSVLASWRSAGDAGFQVVNHCPETVNLASFDDFQWLEAVEGVVGGIEPLRQKLRVDHFDEALLEAFHFTHSAQAGLANRFAALPVGNRPLGKARQARERSARQTHLGAQGGDK